MKHLFLILTFLGFTINADLKAQNSGFSDEELNYKISYSIFTIGKASIVTEDLMETNGTSSKYKVTAKGETTGLLGVFSNIDDEWGAHVYKDNLIPSFSYRRIREGKYKRDEDVIYSEKQIILNEYSFKRKKYKDPVIFDTYDKVYELLSGLLYVRSLDFTSFKEDESFSMKVFFENEFYDFKVLFKGRERIRTKIGKINAIKLVPIMPDNKIFDGENAITIWVSDDKNKIPLKVEADLFLGSAGCYITEHKNLKYPLNRS